MGMIYWSAYFVLSSFYIFFFFNDTATTEIYTLSLHDALPIPRPLDLFRGDVDAEQAVPVRDRSRERDRKSTRLNSSHGYISYAVFCLKKKKKCVMILNTKIKTIKTSSKQ